jgi:FkbM family methyltransferase
MRLSQQVKGFLFRHLTFEQYLLTLSRLYFFSYRMGWLRGNPKIAYPYYLRRVVRRGDTVIDIGANLGYYACLFAGWVGKSGKIYAVEPVAPVRNVLCRNLRRYPQAEILPFALGAENKTIRLGNDSLHRFGYVASGSHFVMDATDEGAPDMTFDAEMRRGSELFADLPRLDFIKCDTEGYESVILPEMRQVIARHHPSVLVETNGDNRPQIISMMKELGYNAFVLKKMKLCPLQDADNGDILFMHPDRK